ncbi:SGNH/GDSL hydrolase family protein [Streptomyces sp. NBC_01476]|uniref:SGNH/GDSL hydrolase family protein n=1 Tax=Streptomyces sp. NBC_01476 TaxID=2903881 RepID=UPI002E30B9F6|nr:SGNH/GDSL hydrolase family protein [Streptomyces sp. NBC_01476]
MARGRAGHAYSVVAAAVTVALAITVALLTAGTPAVGAHPYTVRVMPLGDSITWGQGSPTRSGYRKPLWDLVTGRQSRYTVDFVGSQRNGDLPDPANEGHRGWTIDGVRSRLDGWLAAYRPEVVLLHLGINDLLHHHDPAHAPERLAALVDRIYADRPGVSVVYMGLLPNTVRQRAQTTAFNRKAAALEGTERRRGRAFWYVAPPRLGHPDMADGVHPDDAGYRKMAAVFFPALNSAVRDRMRRLAPASASAAPPL